MMNVRSLGAFWMALAVAGAACSPEEPEPQPFPGLVESDTLRVRTLAPGIEHAYAWQAAGPWAIHVVRVDRSVCEPVLEARKAGPELEARARTSELAEGALVSVNADFFALPAGTPAGAHVEAGETLAGPGERPVFAVTHDEWWIGQARVAGVVVSGRDSATVVQVNRPSAPGDGVTLHTRWAGTTPSDTTAFRVTVRLLEADGGFGRALVAAVDSPARPRPVAEGEVVLVARGTARRWASRRDPGDTIAWRAAVVPAEEEEDRRGAVEAVAGFPTLLRGGEDALARATLSPGFAEERHPRTAVGWTRDRGRLLLVVVDGRQPPYSDGMTLAELTALLGRLDATDALNLDGGGSTTLVLEGEVANRPSDPLGERPVGNALALTGCR